MKQKILALLKSTQGYISGQELCERFGVSRTAVWKAIKQLQTEGYQIEAVNNKGYHLVGSADVMTKEEILDKLNTKWIGRELICYKETGSTNNDIKRAAEDGAGEGLVIVADTQNGGRGRRGRVWQSPPGTSIAVSLLLRPDIRPENASMLTLVSALAVARTMNEILPGACSIKWPNDVLLHNKKVCGILTEMAAEPETIHYVVPGIGINVNQEEFPEDIRDIATSILIETGKKYDRSAFVAKFLAHFEEEYGIFMETQDLSGLIEEYNSILANKDKEVRVLDPKGEFSGIARGIDMRGQLQVELETGEITSVYAGEVSVRGIYGYV